MSIIRTCGRPGPGKDIKTYTVDQLLKQTKERYVSSEQMYGEIERRARLWDEYGDGGKMKRAYKKCEDRARMWDVYGDPAIDKGRT
jgi:hypothetical protein